MRALAKQRWTAWSAAIVLVGVGALAASTSCTGVTSRPSAGISTLRSSSTAQAQKLPETAKNLDFEASATPAGGPQDWGGGGEGYEITPDDKAAHGGKQCGRVAYIGESAPKLNAFGTLTQGISAEAYRGQRVRYTGYVRTEKVEGRGVGLWLRVDGPPEGKPLAFDNMQTSRRAITGTTDWKEYEIVLDVPKEATAIYFGMLLTGKGTAWVDDLKLEAVGSK